MAAPPRGDYENYEEHHVSSHQGFGDLVMPLSDGVQVLRVHAFDTDKDIVNPSRYSLFDKTGNRMAGGIHLDGQADSNTLLLAQFDQAVEASLPIAISRQVIIGQKEFVNAVFMIGPDDRLQIVGRTETTFLSLHVLDGTK